jgi:hypothetical protein
MSSSALQAAVLAWMKQHLEAAVISAISGNTNADTPSPGIAAIQEKVNSIMVSISDIQSLLAIETTAEQKLLEIVRNQSVTISSLKTQLELASASSDQAAISAVVSQMQTNISNLNAAAEALSASMPSSDPSQLPPPRDPTPQQSSSGDIVPPGKPVIG